MVKFSTKITDKYRRYKFISIRYAYGTTNLNFSQRKLGETTKKSFTIYAPTKWKGINCAEYEDIRPYVGASLHIKFNSSGNVRKYELDFLLTVTRFDYILRMTYKGETTTIEFLPFA